jgi:hypothetical protein
MNCAAKPKRRKVIGMAGLSFGGACTGSQRNRWSAPIRRGRRSKKIALNTVVVTRNKRSTPAPSVKQ